MADYQERIRALRALGAEGSGGTDAERKLANEKADELEAKYGKTSSTTTNDTTVTGRDGNPFRDWETVWDLFHRQASWNRPPEADIVEEQYRYQANDDIAEWYNDETGEWEALDNAE